MRMREGIWFVSMMHERVDWVVVMVMMEMV